MDSSLRTKKIVLAEGENIIAEILPQFLKPMGYEVMISRDGASALEMIKKELPDLIIADSDLDKIDGFTLCKILKSIFITAYIPIILLIDKKKIRKKVLEIQEGIDDYIFKPPDPIDLQVRLEMALRRSDHQIHANSLTRLPGNKAIEITIRARLQNERPFSFMYLDINNFKSFNDTYGYVRGDGVIMQVSRIMMRCVSKLGNPNDFVGHIGGDDFVVVTTPPNERKIAAAIIAEFDRLIPLHYNEEDRMMGYLAVKDRQNREIKAPLMGISITIVNNTFRKIHNMIELTEMASEIKSYIKTFGGSGYLINRRSTIDQNKLQRPKTDLRRILESSLYNREAGHALPIGQRLLQANLINREQLDEALVEHWSSRKLLGQTLIKMGVITNSDLEPFFSKF
ncbi:MAG: diguanylate cyclase [Candidatus Omnitrophota bacterium]